MGAACKVRYPKGSALVSENKQIVQRYMEAYAGSDHEAVLSCLTDDVEWLIPGHVHLRGKAAFETEIRNPAFESKLEITVTRLVEERGTNGVRAVEAGAGRASRRAARSPA